MNHRSAVLLLLLTGCGARTIPPHLRVDAPTSGGDEASDAPVRSLDAAAARLVRTDPLVRRPDPGTLDTWLHVQEREPIEAWARLARKPLAPAKTWSALEAAYPGTLAVPLARGAGLAALEAAAAVVGRPGEEDLTLLAWLGPVVVGGAPLPAAARRPLAWLEPDPEAAPAAVLRWSERSVLLGWLDAPGVPLEAAARALQPGVYDRLIDSPAGALLRARADRTAHAGSLGRAKEALAQGTHLALQRVAADRDAEQEQWRRTREGLTETLGSDPVATLLASARTQATEDAAQDEAVAIGLLAMAAERIHGSCPDQPCSGLDRVAALGAAVRWDPDQAATVAVWQAIALKAALDRLEVTRERVGVPGAWADLADALLGTGGGSVPQHLLRTRTPTAATWLALSRAAGATDATTWNDCHAALERRLDDVVGFALSQESLPSDTRALLQRIRRRLR